MVTIIKAVRERCQKDISESIDFKHIYKLFWLNEEEKFYYQSMHKYMEIVQQQEYQIIHDIIADLFYKQITEDYAYTSSSAIAGHHAMNYDGTLIFICGEPYFVCDKSIQEQENFYETIMEKDW